MTDTGDPAERWLPTEVIIRADIYQAARACDIDIGEVCNRALAKAVGIGYEKKAGQSASLSSVIVAVDGGTKNPAASPAASRSRALHPVINADDPAARSKVKLIKPQPAAARTQEPNPGEKENILPAGVDGRRANTLRQTKSPAKKTRQDLMKRFFSSCITRRDEEGPGISKDALYDAFTRWCREHRIQPVPDRRSLTVALKNQFALQEAVINDIPSWTGVQLIERKG